MVKFGCTALGSYPDAITATRLNKLDTYEVACERAKYPRSHVNTGGVLVSIHGPFFISLTNNDKYTDNLSHVGRLVNAASQIGADRVVIHSSLSTRKVSDYEVIVAHLSNFIDRIPELKRGSIKIALENPGNNNIYGSDLSELLKVIATVPQIIPCIDIGHVSSASRGACRGRRYYEDIFDAMLCYFGDDYVMNNLHFHMSQQEFGDKGEIRHANFGDGYLPEVDPFIKFLASLGKRCNARVICESKSNLIKDALTMKNKYLSLIR